MSSQIEYQESTIATAKGQKHALVMAPRVPVAVGAERLSALRRGLERGSIDDECISEVRRRGGRIQVLVFRGRNDSGSGAWSFGEGLTAADETELGRLIVKSMETTRRLLTAEGVFVHVHSDFTFRDAQIFKNGTECVIAEATDELARGELTDDRRTELKVDLWTLKHLCFYFTLPLSKVLRDVLPDKLPLLERRAQSVRELARQLR